MSASTPADAPVAAFAGQTWRVVRSDAAEVGSTYRFAEDGTLVVDSPHGTPMTGAWSYAGGRLVMTEEGVAYPTDILALDAGHFSIRSHNPGGAVDIEMVRAGTR